MKHLSIFIVVLLGIFVLSPLAIAEEMQATTEANPAPVSDYIVGTEDILDINILQPEQLPSTVTVAMDGSINFPYIGKVQVSGMTLTQIRDEIQKKLADGYMNYPVVSVALRENRSKKFFVYGEVIKPGTYLLDENITVLKALSIAGGFTKYGSSSKVKVLRPKKDGAGYTTHKVNMNAAMAGNSKADMKIEAGDIIVVSEGIF